MRADLNFCSVILLKQQLLRPISLSAMHNMCSVKSELKFMVYVGKFFSIFYLFCSVLFYLIIGRPRSILLLVLSQKKIRPIDIFRWRPKNEKIRSKNMSHTLSFRDYLRRFSLCLRHCKIHTQQN